MDLWTFGSEARGQSADLSSAPSPAVAPPRRRRRVHMRILIALAAVLALEACGESTSVLPAPDRPSGRPASVIVTPGALVLSPGGSARLSARVRDSEYSLGRRDLGQQQHSRRARRLVRVRHLSCSRYCDND